MVRMRLKSLLYSSKRTRRVASLLLLALATSPLLLVASGPSTKAGEAKGSTKKETSPLATQAVKHFDRQEQIIDLAREENKKQTRMSNRIFDLSLEVGGTNAELDHVGGLLNKLDRLTRRDIPEPRTPEERVVSYLKREGILIFEIASLDSEIRGLKRFQEGLARLREGVYQLRETASEIAKRFDRLRLLKQRVDLSKLNYEAARNNNWNLGEEALLYTIGFKWLWGLFTGYKVTTYFENEEANLSQMRGQENKERPQLLSEIASLETKLREDVEKLRETLPTILAGSPNLKMTLKLRTGIKNLLDLFLASIRSRQRLLEEEARVERLIETGALKHNQIVSYLGGLRINFNSSNRLFAEYEFKAEDGRWGGDYAFSSREGGKVEIWKPFSSAKPTGSSGAEANDPNDTTGKFEAAQRQGLANRYWDFDALGGIQVAELRRVIPFAWTTSIIPSLTFNPKTFVTETQRWLEQAQIFHLRAYSEAVREHASISAQLNDLFRPNPLPQTLRENSLEAILSFEPGLLEKEEILANLRAELDALRYQLKGLGRELTKRRLQHVLDREIANRRRRLEQILGSKRLVTALSNSIKKTAEVGSLYVSYDQILSEAAKAKSLLEELIELDTTRENLRDDVNLEGLAYEKKTEKGYSLRGEVYQYLFGFKWLWGAFIGYASTSLSLKNEYQSLTSAKDRLEIFETTYKGKKGKRNLLNKRLERQIKRVLRLVAEIRSTLPVNLLPDLDRFETVFRTYLEAMRQVSYDYLLAHNLLSEAIRNRIDDAKIDHAESQAQVVEIPSVAEWLLEGGRSALISAAKSWVGLSREQKMARYQGALRLFEGVKHNFELAFNLLPAILTDQLVKSEEAKSRQLSNQIEAGRDVAGYLLKHLFEHRKGLESLLVSTTKTAKSRQHLLKGSFPLFREELKVFEAIEQRETDLAEGKRLLREDHSRLLLTTKEGEETEGQGVKKEAKK